MGLGYSSEGTRFRRNAHPIVAATDLPSAHCSGRRVSGRSGADSGTGNADHIVIERRAHWRERDNDRAITSRCNGGADAASSAGDGEMVRTLWRLIAGHDERAQTDRGRTSIRYRKSIGPGDGKPA